MLAADKPVSCEATPVKPPRRLNLDPDRVEKDVARLVLVVVELLRRVLEHEAMRRIDGGGLSPATTARLGLGLMRLEEQVRLMQDHFGIEDLDLDLGPVGKVLGPARRGSPARAGRRAHGHREAGR